MSHQYLVAVSHVRTSSKMDHFKLEQMAASHLSTDTESKSDWVAALKDA